MQFVSDLHLHSKYSRAVSQNMVLPIMAEWGKKKGIDILSTGDWTHPLWLREKRSQLEEKGEGLFNLKSQISNLKSTSQISNLRKEPLFLLSTEIASIYKQGEKVRRIHNLIFAPNFETVEKINQELTRRGCNLHSDGRPIIGISSKNLLELLLEIDKKILLIPCHVWTPHFGVYGSKSGFETLSECFEDLVSNVYGIETGISSDPEMNWRIEDLKERSILSFSDAHSPANMGRETTAFELDERNFENIRTAIMRKGGGKNRIAYTVEFYPEEGKYHFSGHRNCKVSFTPQEVREKGAICPVCKREFTEGVAPRIEQLGGSDFAKEYKEKVSETGVKWYTDETKNHPPYVKLVPLLEIVAEGLESTVSSQKVKAMFDSLCEAFGSEIDVLLKTHITKIQKITGPKIAEGIEKVREGTIVIDPGYDGEYGHVKIWGHDESKIESKQEDEKMQMGLGF